MQPNDTSDPRRAKALKYLGRIQRYYASSRSQLYETWCESPADEDNAFEITGKRFDVIRSVAHAVRILGGKTRQLEVAYMRFVDDEFNERHAVFVLRFKLPTE